MVEDGHETKRVSKKIPDLHPLPHVWMIEHFYYPPKIPTLSVLYKTLSEELLL